MKPLGMFPFSRHGEGRSVIYFQIPGGRSSDQRVQGWAEGHQMQEEVPGPPTATVDRRSLGAGAARVTDGPLG